MEAIDFSKNLRIYKSRLKPVASKDRILELVDIIIEESQEIQKKQTAILTKSNTAS